jgi:phosphodiesterase/alkaline phosphatase D-like protein
MDRRAFLGATARLAALAALGQAAACVPTQPVKLNKDPFTLGVASGDPLPDGVVLWTRLAPDPLVGGGMPSSPVDVEWLDGVSRPTRQSGKGARIPGGPAGGPPAGQTAGQPAGKAGG